MKTQWKRFILACLAAAIPSLQSQGQIDAGPNLNFARMAHHLAKLSDGRVVVLGGHGPGFVALNTAEIWSAAANSFTSFTMAYRHDVPAFARLADGRYLIAGGSANLGIPADATSEIFDPQTTAFNPTGSMIRFRASAGAATLNNGKVLIAGAWWTHNDAHTYGELFDPSAGTFSVTGALNRPRANPIVLPTADGGAIVVGGFHYTGGSIAALPELYNTAENTFSPVRDDLFPGEPGWIVHSIQEPIDTARLADGRYLLLASRPDSHTLLTFDPVSREFTKFETTPPLPSPATLGLWYPLINSAKTRAYLLGFVPGVPTIQPNVLTLDLTTGALTTQIVPGEFPNNYSLANSTQCLLNDGRIMIIGGTTGNNFGALPYTVFITPSEPLSLEIAMYAGIQITGTVGNSYRIEYAEEAGAEWNLLTTLTLPASPYLYIDLTSRLGQRRIYRAILVE